MTEGQDKSQPLIEHLIELRTRIIYSAYIIFCGFLVSWFFSEQIFDIIRQPISPYLPDGLVFTAPMDKFIAHLKVSFLAGVIVTAPAWIYQVWRFIAPGLYRKERKYVVGFISFGTGLFLTGIAFVYFVVFPMAFKFLMTFGGSADKPMITIGEYLSFFFITAMAFGAAFEIPLILTVLGMMGIIDHKFLASKRRVAILILAVISAVITPPDALSMILMLIPLIFLYEMSILLVKFFGAQTSLYQEARRS